MRARLGRLAILFGVASLLSSANLDAAPLIVAQPYSKAVFNGDLSAKFEVLATGTVAAPTYLWEESTDGGNTFHSIVGAEFTGVLTATLTIALPTTFKNGYKYHCQVTDGATATSAKATLNAYVVPSVTPVVTVTPATLAADSTVPITIHVTGLTAGDTVRIHRVLDVDTNGSIGIGEPLVSSFLVTDGQSATFGGVPDPNIPGDDDSVVGEITTHISLPASPEVGRSDGQYIVRVASPTGAFRAVDQILTVTQPSTGQSVSGQVKSGGVGVPKAIVVLLASTPNGDQQYVASTLANGTGNYTINAPPGTYAAIASQIGYTMALSAAPSFTLGAGQTLTGKDPPLTAATRTITGTVRDLGSGPSLRGVQLFAQSQTNYLTLITSDFDGVYDISAIADQWQIETSDLSLALVGHLGLQNKATADTTAASVIQNDISLPAVTALVYGTVKNSSNVPLAGVQIRAGDNNNTYQGGATTDANGMYFIGVIGNTVGGTNMWNVQPDNPNPALAGYIPPPGQNFTPVSGGANQINFVAQAPTAHLQGTVTKLGVPVAGVTMLAVQQSTMNGITVSTVTDASGNFDLGVVAGMWNVQLETSSAISNNILGPIIPETVVNGQTIAGIAFQVVDGTNTISGTVVYASGQPITNGFVNGSATPGSITYQTGAQTDGSGNYSFPVIAGTWTVQVSGPGANPQIVVVPPSRVVNFVVSVIANQPQNQIVTAGQGASFSIGTNTPGSNTVQWQRLPAGTSTWADLGNSAPYSGVTTNGLGVANTTILMNGDQFRCVVSYTVGATPAMETSNAATLTVITPFQAWRIANFTPAQLSDPSISSALATPVGDGVANLMKYALNLQPFTNCTTLVPRPTRAGNTLTMTYQASHGDVTYTPQVSNDLQLWTSNGVITTAPPTVTATFDTTGQPQTFMRLMVTQP